MKVVVACADILFCEIIQPHLKSPGLPNTTLELVLRLP